MWESIYKVAKREGINKCTLYYQTNHIIPNPVYFRRLKVPGKKDKIMIETDDPMWKAWLEDYRVRKGFEELDNVHLQKLVKATVIVIKKYYAPSRERLDELLTSINKEFQSYE